MATSKFYTDGTGGSAPVPERSMSRSEFQEIVQSLAAREETALGQVEGLAAAGIVKAVSVTPGAKEFKTVTGEDLAELTETAISMAAGGAIDLAYGTTVLVAASGSHALTLENGAYDGQQIFICMGDAASTATWTAASLTNFFNFTQFELTAASHSLLIKWNELAGKWFYVGGNCLLS